MSTFSLSSVHWDFRHVAAAVAMGAFAAAVGVIVVLILINVFNSCYDFCRDLLGRMTAAGEGEIPRSIDVAAPATIYASGGTVDAQPGREPDGDCAICLEEFAGGAEVRVMPRCKHTFHKSCIDQWLGVRSEVCPLCRDHVIDIEKSLDHISIDMPTLAIADDV